MREHTDHELLPPLLLLFAARPVEEKHPKQLRKPSPAGCDVGCTAAGAFARGLADTAASSASNSSSISSRFSISSSCAMSNPSRRFVSPVPAVTNAPTAGAAGAAAAMVKSYTIEAAEAVPWCLFSTAGDPEPCRNVVRDNWQSVRLTV